MRHEEDEEFYEDDLEQEVLNEEEGEEKKNKNKLKLFIPLIALVLISVLFGAYYYVSQLQNSLGSNTPVSEVPEPTDTTITGGESLDQVVLAEAQLKKEQEDAMKDKKVVSDEELTRVDFSIKSKSNTEEKKVQAPTTTTIGQPILNNEMPIKKQVSNNHRNYIVKKQIQKNNTISKHQTNPSNDEDPFNIVVAQKATSQAAKTTNTEKPTNSEPNDYNDYLKKFSKASQDEEPIPAVIAGRQRIIPGQTVAIKIQKDMLVNGQTVKKGSLIYGLPTVDDGRISIRIRNIKNGSTLIKANISVLGEDMNEGVQYQVKGTTDLSQTKGQIVDIATSQLGTIGSIISGTSRSTTKSREPEYWLNDGKKVYLSIN